MELILTEWLGADGSFVSLSDDRILELNTDIIFKELFNELLKKLPDSKILKKGSKQDLKSYIQDLSDESNGIINILRQNTNNCNKYDSLLKELDKIEVKTITWGTVRNVLKLEIDSQIREKIEDIILRIISYVEGNRKVLNKISKKLGINIPEKGVINREDVYFNHKNSLKTKIQEIVSNENSIEQLIKKTSEINDHHKNGDANKNPICEIKKIGEQYFIWTYQYAAEFEITIKIKKAEEPLKIRIEPRNMITEKHYHKMLESVFNFQVMDSISGQKSSHFILLYLMAFLGRVEQTLQRGVYREYVDREENLHYLKERLLIADHLRENRVSPDRVYCAFSELSGDNIINQTINQTLNHVKKAYSDSALQTRIRKIQNRLTPDELSDVPVSLSQIKSLHYNRANKPYEEIMGYCYNILQNIGGCFGSTDNLKYSAFYVDMNELYETYIGNLLAKKDPLVEDIWETVCGNENTDAGNINSDAYYVEPQNRGRYYLAEDGGAFNQEIRPDFLIKKNEDNSVAAVLDTKYKRLFDRRDLHYGIHREDIYQVITYGYRFNTDKIFLVYPKSPNYSQDNLISITIPSKEGDSKKLYIAYVNLLEDKTK